MKSKIYCLDGFWIPLLVLVISISCQFRVEAARVLQGDFVPTGNNYISMYPLYEKAKDQMAYLFERLASAPSGRGGGH